jgi:hypothetical protein
MFEETLERSLFDSVNSSKPLTTRTPGRSGRFEINQPTRRYQALTSSSLLRIDAIFVRYRVWDLIDFVETV